ncbi:hypothetical protein LSAT2_017125 [Lamellibrachia satsuma]|nr:hypothetical protein LSAT2_017125 [Lamellibrachia satsuma]
MVQLYYYERRGDCCRTILQHDGYPSRVLLFPYEGWARPAVTSYWLIKRPWWGGRRCRVVEVRGMHKYKAKGKMKSLGKGTMMITGTFKDRADPDFRLVLSSDVTDADFELGYCMTGVVERGSKKDGHMEVSHFAMIKRKGY